MQISSLPKETQRACRLTPRDEGAETRRSVSLFRLVTKKPLRCRLYLPYISLVFLILGVLGVNGNSGAWPFADYVFEYRPGPGQWTTNPQYNDPSRALGRPYGGTVTAPDNSSLVSLGDGGYIILGFNRPVWDDPNNPHGLDFIVFGNSTWVGGNPSYRWQEPAFVEVSMDANENGLPDDEWFLLLPNKLPSELVGAPASGADTGHSSTVLRQYAEYTPTLALPAGKTAEEFYAVPDRWSYQDDPSSLLIDDGSGGGDAFDLALAVRQTSAGTPIQPLEYVPIPYANFIRITDALEGDSAGILGEISAEIDAVSDVSPLPGGATIGAAKARPDGTVISLPRKVVSAVFPGELYVQEEDRSSGIRVNFGDGDPVSVGGRVDVIGILCTENGERYLNRASVLAGFQGDPPRPLGTRASQVGGSGLDNTGLLISIWGRVSSSTSGYFYVNDGSLPNPGLVVRCDGLTPPAESRYAIVTGVSCRESGSVPALRVREQTDISFALE